MVELKKLIIKNFLSVGKNHVEIDFQKGITIFVGKNGAGKSTVLDALNFVLFGEAYSNKKKSDLVNWINKKDCQVELMFSNKNHEYSIKRQIKPDKIFFTKDDEIIDISGIDDLNKQIEQNLGIDKRIFAHTVFVSVNFFTPFLNLKSNEKRDFLKRIFSLEKFEEMEEMIKTDIKKLENDVLSLQYEIRSNQGKQDLIEKHIQEKQESISLNVKNIETRISEKENELKKYEHNFFGCKMVDKTEFNDKYLEVSSEKLKLQNELKNYNEEYQRNEQNKNRLLQLEEKLKTTINKKEEKEKLLIELKKSLEGSDPINEDKIQNDKKTIDTLKNKISHNTTLIGINTKTIKFYQHNDKCDSCKQDITSEYKNEQLDRLNNDNVSYEKEIEQYKREIEFINEEINKEVRRGKIISEVNTQIRMNNIDHENEMIEEIHNSIKNIVVKDIKSNTSEIEQRIKEITEQENELKKEINDAEMINRNYIRIQNEIESTKRNIVTLIEDKEKTSLQFDKIDLSELESVNSLICENIKNENMFNSKLDIMKTLLISVKDKGIKNYIISKYIPLINSLTVHYSEIIGSTFQVKFKSNGMDVDILKRGNVVEYGNLSSGQQQRINLIILFSFIKFLRIKSGLNFPLIFLDEILNSSLDHEGISGLVQILEDMKNDIGYINIISHDADTLNFADRIIRVSNNNNFSDYEVV